MEDKYINIQGKFILMYSNVWIRIIVYFIIIIGSILPKDCKRNISKSIIFKRLDN